MDVVISLKLYRDITLLHIFCDIINLNIPNFKLISLTYITKQEIYTKWYLILVNLKLHANSLFLCRLMPPFEHSL